MVIVMGRVRVRVKVMVMVMVLVMARAEPSVLWCVSAISQEQTVESLAAP